MTGSPGEAVEPPPGWSVQAGALQARFATATFAAGLAFVNRIGALAEAADHHPDVLLTYAQVTVRTHSHDVGAVTHRDHQLARQIGDLAAEAGIAQQQP